MKVDYLINNEEKPLMCSVKNILKKWKETRHENITQQA